MLVFCFFIMVFEKHLYAAGPRYPQTLVASLWTTTTWASRAVLATYTPS